jgi:hypothetical protein
MSRSARFLLLAGLLVGPAALAAEPTAIVEDVQGAVKDVQVFDYLSAGTEIQLPARGILVLGYLKSCARETITGGKVRVGTESSAVEGGQVKSERVECDGGRMKLSDQQAARSGVMTFRSAPKPNAAPAPAASAAPAPQVVVYGVSPIFTLERAERLEIKRLDAAGQAPLDLPLAKPKPGRAVVVDLAKQNIVLAAGGVYQASGDGRSVVFKVDPGAKPGAAPAVGRLVRVP